MNTIVSFFVRVPAVAQSGARRGLFWLSALAFAVLAPVAGASTQAENMISSAPMPHELLGQAGALVKVHRVRLDGYLDGVPDNASRMAQLKREVQQCVAEHKQGGYPSKPPAEWPSYLLSLRKDTYSARNRSIAYSRGVAYVLNPMDCSLRENISMTAELQSSKGICLIDLKQKTAEGVCDASAHANAPVRPMRGAPGLRGSGQKKNILGIDCEVWSQVPSIGGTACLARGGTFQPAMSAGNPGEAGMELDVDTRQGFKMKAIAAKLDADVDVRVFAPYLQGGFDLNGASSK